jgi:hypothetical protein
MALNDAILCARRTDPIIDADAYRQQLLRKMVPHFRPPVLAPLPGIRA